MTPLGEVAEYRYVYGDSTPHTVWKEKTERMIASLISAGADSKLPCVKMPLLNYAFSKENQPLAELALANGADPIQKGTNIHNTFLHRLSSQPYAQGWMAKLLVRHGADPNAVDDNGDTPLLSCARFGSTLSYISELLVAGADIDAQNREGYSAVAYTCVTPRPPILAYLLESGAKPDTRDKYGNYPINYTITFRNRQCITLLLDAGADPNRSFPERNILSYLMEPARQSRAEVLCPLVGHGANPNVRDADGNTPLHLAAASGYPNEGGWCVEALLKAGADVHAKNNAGLTPLDIAKKGKNSVVIKMLTDAGKR